MKRLLALFCCSCPCLTAWADVGATTAVEIVEARPYATHTWNTSYALLAEDLGEVPTVEDTPTAHRVEIPHTKPRLRSSTRQEATETSDGFDFEEYAKAQFATFRSSGNVYFKGRAGYLWETEDEHPDNLSIGQMVNGLNSHGAFGVGAGYKLSNGERVEFDYTINRRDEKVFSIGYKF